VQHQALISELRARLASLSTAISASCAQGLTDLPKHSEDLVAGLLRELLGYRNIRNLNSGGNPQFPGLDLGDDEKRTGFQVTATASLDKVRDTLATVLRHGLEQTFPIVKIVVLTRKQSSYSQPAIDVVINGKFSGHKNILELSEILTSALPISPVSVRRALDVMDAYERGAISYIAEADFDPPAVTETVELNLLELFIAPRLFVADLHEKPKTRSDARKHVRAIAANKGLKLPSGYEVHEGRLVTFHNLDAPTNPFAELYDLGTVTPLNIAEFWRIDADYENRFKSLLRLCLQEQLYKERVQWRHDEKVFAFVPLTEGKLDRKETWIGKARSTRTVVLYRVSKKDPSKGGFRHFAFQAEFLRVDDNWFVALRPDWYFSAGDGTRTSPIAPQLLKGIKRLETNKSVEQHFRFLCWWLKNKTEADLVTSASGFLSFGDAKKFDNHPGLDASRWLPTSMDHETDHRIDEFVDLLSDL
jgi:hypothetical protein